jgi:hypothetical protein
MPEEAADADVAVVVVGVGMLRDLGHNLARLDGSDDPPKVRM